MRRAHIGAGEKYKRNRSWEKKNLSFYSLTVAAPPTPHATQSRVSGTFWSEGVKLGLAEVEERCCYNYLCVSLPASIGNKLFFSQDKSVSLATVTCKQSPCLYLNLWALLSYLLTCTAEEGLWMSSWVQLFAETNPPQKWNPTTKVKQSQCVKHAKNKDFLNLESLSTQGNTTKGKGYFTEFYSQKKKKSDDSPGEIPLPAFTDYL